MRLISGLVNPPLWLYLLVDLQFYVTKIKFTSIIEILTLKKKTEARPGFNTLTT